MVAAKTYCGWCGNDLATGDHAICRKRLSSVDPPRFCPECARRMVVQVTPVSWTARCSRHGERTSQDDTPG
jgi:hypothetical protein